jgi:hypothetical protein
MVEWIIDRTRSNLKVSAHSAGRNLMKADSEQEKKEKIINVSEVNFFLSILVILLLAIMMIGNYIGA